MTSYRLIAPYSPYGRHNTYCVCVDGRIEEAYIDLVEFLEALQNFSTRFANRIVTTLDYRPLTQELT